MHSRSDRGATAPLFVARPNFGSLRSQFARVWQKTESRPYYDLRRSRRYAGLASLGESRMFKEETRPGLPGRGFSRYLRRRRRVKRTETVIAVVAAIMTVNVMISISCLLPPKQWNGRPGLPARAGGV